MGVERQEAEYGNTEDNKQSIKEGSTLKIASGQYNAPHALGDLVIQVEFERTGHEGEGFTGYL